MPQQQPYSNFEFTITNRTILTWLLIFRDLMFFIENRRRRRTPVEGASLATDYIEVWKDNEGIDGVTFG